MLVEILPWVCSVLALLSIYLIGNKSIFGPIVAIAGQPPFWLVIILTGAHGFWPATIAATVPSGTRSLRLIASGGYSTRHLFE